MFPQHFSLSQTFTHGTCFLFLEYLVFLFSEISLTQCQKQLQEAINLPPDPERFVPRCKFDGSYEEVQCQNSTGLCWCVDQDGNEMSSTATSGTVTCPNIGEIFLGICVFVFLTVLRYKCKLLGGEGTNNAQNEYKYHAIFVLQRTG